MKMELLQAALIGLEYRLEEVNANIAEVQGMLGNRQSATNDSAPAAASDGAPKKRVMSEAGRKRISAAARKRWAAYNKAKRAG